MELQELLNQIKDAEEISKLDLTGWDYQSRPGMETRKRLAVDNIDNYRKQYKEQVLKRVVKVIPTGPSDRISKFVELAKNEGAIVVNGADLYTKLAEPVFTTIGQEKLWTIRQSQRLLEEMTEYARKYEIDSLPYPKMDGWQFLTPITSLEDTVNYVRDSVRATSNDELNVFHLGFTIAEEAYKQGAVARVVPVVVYNLTSDEVSAIKDTLLKDNMNVVVNLEEQEPSHELIVKLSEGIARRVGIVVSSQVVDV